MIAGCSAYREAELYQIKLRLHQGEGQKAARGELRLPLPAGLVYGRMAVSALIAMKKCRRGCSIYLAQFRELRSTKAVMRHFQEANLMLPVRSLAGPAPHAVTWRPASNARIVQVLKNPAYAGAYVYGRRRRTAIGRHSGSQRGATEAVAIQDWPVCLKDAFPGYIDWEEFMANQQRLADDLNATRQTAMWCHGEAMYYCKVLRFVAAAAVGRHYSGPHGSHPVYVCRAGQDRYGGQRCQEVLALGVDAAIERLLLEALTTDRLALAMATLCELENEARALEH